jgi:hypothetical protein
LPGFRCAVSLVAIGSVAPTSSVGPVERFDRDAVKNASMRRLFVLARALGCELDELIADEWRPPRAAMTR